LLFILLVMSISRINGHFPFLIPFRPLLVISAGALAWAVISPRLLSRLPWWRTWPARSCVGLGVTACFSAVFGISLGGAGRFIIEDYSKVLVAAFLLMGTIASARDLHMYIWAYVIACGVLVVDALLGGQMRQASFDSSLQRLSGFNSTYDANDVGVVLLTGLALALYTFQTSRVLGKVVSLATILGMGAVLAKTGSRGAFVGLVALGLAALLLLDNVTLPKRLGLIVATGAALLFASPDGYWDQMRTVFSPQQDYNWTAETGRRMVTQRGLQYLAAYPVFGLGINNFPMAEGTLSERARTWLPGDAGVAWTAPHNSFLEVASEMGLVGFALWSSLVFGIIWSLSRLGRRLPKGWKTGGFEQRVLGNATRCIPVATVGFAVSAFFVSFAYLEVVYTLAAFAVGVHVLMRWGGSQGESSGIPGRLITSRMRGRV
jgi:O-antigen ligase